MRSLSKKLRFEILKRDEFKCRYCGRTEADGVKLHVDHVIAVALGGRNDPDNLATACADCNLGKAANMLTDPKLIGVDFETRKAVFEKAQTSLQAYREYVAAKEKFEYDLVSELLAPMRQVFLGHCTVWQIDWGRAYWRYGEPITIEELPPGYRADAHLSAIKDSVEDAEARAKRSVLYFLRHLGPDEIREAATIAAHKAILEEAIDSDEAFAYLCGICHRKIRQRYGADPEGVHA